MKNIKKKIAIIGAGISGLYLAWKTSKKSESGQSYENMSAGLLESKRRPVEVWST